MLQSVAFSTPTQTGVRYKSLTRWAHHEVVARVGSSTPESTDEMLDASVDTAMSSDKSLVGLNGTTAQKRKAKTGPTQALMLGKKLSI
jgi:hypothetical protein